MQAGHPGEPVVPGRRMSAYTRGRPGLALRSRPGAAKPGPDTFAAMPG